MKLDINHAISLGLQCTTAQFLKTNGLKVCSYPFDWMLTPDHTATEDILNNDFVDLLNKKYYVDVTIDKLRKNCCGHSKYGSNLFWHRDMRVTENYEHLKRCVSRFHKVLESSRPKLFMMDFYENHVVNINNLKTIYNILSKKTTNLFLLGQSHTTGKKLSVNVQRDGNIYFYEYTHRQMFDKWGLNFRLEQSRKLYMEMIFNQFNFEIINNKEK